MEIPKDRKMTFIEFVASQESDYGKIDEGWLIHWKEHIPKILASTDGNSHCGDCTNVCAPCTLCTLERWLTEYREYVFDKELRGQNEN